MARATYWKESDSTDVRAQAAIHEGEGTILRRLFFREQSRLGIKFDVWELPPGATEGSHTHEGERALEEIYYVLQGRGVVTVEGEEVAVGPGDAVLVPPGVDHGLVNAGTEPLRLVLLFGKPEPASAR
ncbi:MAG: cupin domain-containing protein [Chloroflexota bacterium]